MSAMMRAKRILHPLKSFLASSKDGLPLYLNKLFICDTHAVIGIYENFLGSFQECFIVTDSCLWIERDGSWIMQEFSDIASIAIPPKSDLVATRLEIAITKADESIVYLPVRGGSRGFFDIFEVARFLMRASKDAKRFE